MPARPSRLPVMGKDLWDYDPDRPVPPRGWTREAWDYHLTERLTQLDPETAERFLAEKADPCATLTIEDHVLPATLALFLADGGYLPMESFPWDPETAPRFDAALQALARGLTPEIRRRERRTLKRHLAGFVRWCRDSGLALGSVDSRDVGRFLSERELDLSDEGRHEVAKAARSLA